MSHPPSHSRHLFTRREDQYACMLHPRLGQQLQLRLGEGYLASHSLPRLIVTILKEAA